MRLQKADLVRGQFYNYAEAERGSRRSVRNLEAPRKRGRVSRDLRRFNKGLEGGDEEKFWVVWEILGWKGGC